MFKQIAVKFACKQKNFIAMKNLNLRKTVQQKKAEKVLRRGHEMTDKHVE